MPGIRLACALTVLAPMGASAEGLPTGRTVEMRLSRVPAGIEPGLPRGGSYGRALDAIRARQYRRARELFLDAAAELRRVAAEGALPPERARTLMFKAELAAMQASRLLLNQREAVGQTPFEQGFREAVAHHNLYLASRAWLGHHDALLYDRAAKAYEAVLPVTAPEQLAIHHVTYAGLLADGGHRRAAQRELAMIPPAERTLDLALNSAHCRAALGDPERALELLDRARDTHPDWRELRRFLGGGNDFDALRDDPRFARLIGDEE